MKAQHITNVEEFRNAQINGISALFTDDRVDRASIPDGLFAYDMRSDNENGNPFSTVEPRVIADFSGTVITKQEMPMNNEGYTNIWEFGYDDETTLEEFLKQKP